MVGSSLTGYGDFRVPPYGDFLPYTARWGLPHPPDLACESASPIARVRVSNCGIRFEDGRAQKGGYHEKPSAPFSDSGRERIRMRPKAEHSMIAGRPFNTCRNEPVHRCACSTMRTRWRQRNAASQLEY
jgi:hypothetical protein